MKKILLIAFVLVLMLVSCTAPEEIIEEDMTITAEIFDLTPSGMRLVITDNSGNDNMYGEWYELERMTDGEWTRLETLTDNYAFTLVGYILDSENKIEFDIDWEWLYGKLEKGSYRIVKKSGEDFIYAEFEI